MPIRVQGLERRHVVGAALVLGLVVLLAILPFGKPEDLVQHVHVFPKFKLKRVSLASRSNERGLPHLPRTVSFETSGPDVRVALMHRDSSAFSVQAMLEASAQLERGEVPSHPSILATASGVTRGQYRLHWWPWGAESYLLIVAGDEEAEVTIRVTYGRW